MLVILLIACICFAIWGRSGRRPPASASDLHLLETRSFGANCGKGNLLGIQPYMLPADYASEERFHAKVNGYLAEAQRRGFIGDKTVVVFPEYFGAWLLLAGEKQAVYRASTIGRASAILAASNPFSFLRWLATAEGPKRTRCALFKMKACSMAAIYQRVFSRSAKTHGVTIIAGSILLPAPEIRDGALTVGRGPLYNTSVIYGPDGRALAPPVKKAFPIAEELEYMASGPVEDLPIFCTPAGSVGVLICADSWYPQAYRSLKSRGADIIAVPAFLSSAGQWDHPWAGYTGAPTPDDVDPRDVQVLTEGEAWMKYALPGRIAQSAARAGITVFLQGRLWEMISDGRTCAVLDGTAHTCLRGDGAAILNLWLRP